MLLLAKLPRFQQPQGLAAVDAKKVKDLGLTAIWIGSQPTRALVLNQETVPDATVLFANSPQGRVASFSDGTNENLIVSQSSDTVLPSLTDATIAILRRNRDTTGRASTAFGYDGGASSRVLAHAPYSDGNLYWDFGDATSGSGRVSVAYTKDTEWETLVFVAGSRGREVWRRGLRIVNNTSATAARSLVGGLEFYLGAVDSGGVTSDLVDDALLVVAGIEWSPAQIVDWCRNPWNLFAPLSRTLWASSGPPVPLYASLGQWHPDLRVDAWF